MMHKGGDLFAHGALLLAFVMGGAILTMARSPTPIAAAFPGACLYGLWYVLAAAKQAQPAFFGGAVAAGVAGSLLFGKPGAKRRTKAAPKKAAKATGKKAK